MLWPFHVYHSSVQAAAAAKKKENTIPYQLNEINVGESVGSNDRVRHLALPFVAACVGYVDVCVRPRVCIPATARSFNYASKFVKKSV